MVVGGVRAGLFNRRHPSQQSDVLIVASGAGLISRDWRSFNRYADHFAECLGDRAWALESLFHNLWPAMPRGNLRLSITADQSLATAIHSRMSTGSTYRNLARELIDLTASSARDRIGWEISDERRASLIAIASRRLAAYPAQEWFTRRTVGRIRPRLVLVEDGCYGHMAVFNATAQRLGVTVAEFQHGMVTRGHDAYNVGSSLVTSERYRLSLPSAFLSYGRWWNEQFNAPLAEKVVIGNPHRTESLRDWRPDTVRRRVLVVGDGVETNAYVELCKRLASSLPPELQVVFRPHPIERDRLQQGPGHSISIDLEPDLYRSIAAAHVVVGEASTVLFEAVGLVPRIFVWDTDKSRFFLGQHPFRTFNDAAEVADLIANVGDDQGPIIDSDDIWSADWQGRFGRFVSEKSN